MTKKAIKTVVCQRSHLLVVSVLYLGELSVDGLDGLLGHSGGSLT